MTFSETFWFSAVEAEVYGLAMLFVFAITYLSLLWSRNSDNSFGNRLLILIIYLCYLGVGVHMYSLITLPAVALFVFFVRKDFREMKSWPVWITGLLLYSIVYKMDIFISLTLWMTVITAVLALVVKNESSPYFKLSFWFCLIFVSFWQYRNFVFEISIKKKILFDR